MGGFNLEYNKVRFLKSCLYWINNQLKLNLLLLDYAFLNTFKKTDDGKTSKTKNNKKKNSIPCNEFLFPKMLLEKRNHSGCDPTRSTCSRKHRVFLQ